VAVNTMLAGMAGSFSAMFYMWIRYGKAGCVDDRQRACAGSVAITRPSGFVNPGASVIIG
jgi:Amt family ammonium transporter